MDFYHSWFYEYVLNTRWFVWAWVILILGGNMAAPIIIWLIMSGKSLKPKNNK